MSSPAVPPEDRARWPWISLTPLGFGCWAPIYGGLKARAPLWVLAGVLWTLILLTGFVLNGTSAHPGSDDLAGACFIVAWIGGAATSFGLRGPYQRRTGSPLQAAAEAGEAALRDEAYARELVRRDPRLAQHMGIGRPDRPGAAAAGLVDMNNADANALSTPPASSPPARRSAASPRSRTSAPSWTSTARSSRGSASARSFCRARSARPTARPSARARTRRTR